MIEEQWKDVVGYEGAYMVSDRGRIRSLDQVVKCKLGSVRTLRGKILAQGGIKDKTRHISLTRDGTQITHIVARLVLYAFRGPPPQGMVACHKSRNVTDNSLTNLHWTTLQENQKAMGSRASRPCRWVLRGDGTEFRSIAEAGRSAGVDSGVISQACRVGCRGGGHHWKYTDAEDSE